MESTFKTQAAKKGKLQQSGKLSQPGSGHSIDVNRVMEHISSATRWELIDIPQVREEPLLVKKYRHQKSIFRK